MKKAGKEKTEVDGTGCTSTSVLRQRRHGYANSQLPDQDSNLEPCG